MKHIINKKFPENFLWGASTSAFQSEGANLMDGRGPIARDLQKPIPGTTDFSVASDFYNRYKEDIRLFSELGLKAFRFSISWSRVIPRGTGEINKKGIEFYNNVINECLKYGIEPLVTMYHFDLPLALEERGGWGNRESVEWFSDYAKILFDNFGDRVKYWLTINEQNVLIYLAEKYNTLVIPENCSNIIKEIYQQNHHMLVAQAKVMKLCHSILPDSKIGPAPNISYVYPATCKPEDIIASENYNALRNWIYLDVAVRGTYNPIVWAWLEEKNSLPDFEEGDENILKDGKPDFIGFNYYNTLTCEEDDESVSLTQAVDQQTARGERGMFRGCKNPYLSSSSFGWEIDSIGFRITLREIYARYQLPMIITENGLGAKDILTEDGKIHDSYRIGYLKEHIEQMNLAISDGCEVFGYCPWSAIDLISTHQGFNKRYGFIYINRDEFNLKDLKRVKKDSFFWYKNVIKNNGEIIDEEI